MTKNITVGISDDLSERMEQMKDVNWSAVTRECIEQYIKQRTTPGLEMIIAKTKEMRNTEFRRGYEFITENSEAMGLAALEEIAYPETDQNEPLGMLYERLNANIADKILRYDTDEEAGTVNNIRYKVSTNFIKGMEEAARELVDKSE